MVDTKKLRESISNSGLKLNYIARQLGITPAGLRKKILNQTEFKAGEIVVLGNVLQMTREERDEIFLI